MSIKSRIEKLEKAQPPPKAEAPRVVIWLPKKQPVPGEHDNTGCPPVGDYLSPCGTVLTRIYTAEEPAAEGK